MAKNEILKNSDFQSLGLCDGFAKVSTISTAQSPRGSPLVTRQTPYMTNPPLPLPLYLLSAPLFYILLYTPTLLHIYPLSTSTHLMPHPPLTLPLYVSTLPLYIPSLYSLSILLSTIPLYNPFLELIELPLYTFLSFSLLSCSTPPFNNWYS